MDLQLVISFRRVQEESDELLLYNINVSVNQLPACTQSIYNLCWQRNFIFVKFNKVGSTKLKINKVILTNKEVNCQRNTKINKESFKFLIRGWDLNSPFVPYLCIKKDRTVFDLSNSKEIYH